MQKNKGFTLIELLVVIAIIGILASVVLASLNSARSKGADAAVKSNLANMRAQAELFYDGNTGTANDSDSSATTTGYDGVCTNATMAAAQAAAVTSGGNQGTCADVTEGWVAWAGLKSTPTAAWCVDSTGASRQIAKPTGDITICPAS